MTTTEHLGLALHNTGSDTSVSFQSWRKAINGSGNNSNMERIDKAYGDLVSSIDELRASIPSSASSVGEMEEIYSVTLPNATNSVRIDKDASGAGFRLSSFNILVYSPGASASSNLNMKFADTGSAISISGALRTSTSCTAVYFTKCKDGYDVRFVCTQGTNMSASTTGYSGALFDTFTERDEVSDIRVYTSTGKTLPAGTIIKIRGVRL